jgi:hypothetical protein
MWSQPNGQATAQYRVPWTLKALSAPPPIAQAPRCLPAEAREERGVFPLHPVAQNIQPCNFGVPEYLNAHPSKCYGTHERICEDGFQRNA